MGNKTTNFSIFLTVAVLLASGVSVQQAEASGCIPEGTTYPSSTGSAGFGGGLGTSISPWEICSPTQLSAIGTNSATRAANYVLKADLDLTGATWTPIGPIFSGVFDGQYKTISNALIQGNPNNGASHPDAGSTDAASDAGTDLYGLFAMVSGTVRKVELKNFVVNSQSDASSQLDSNSQPIYSFQGRFPMSGVLAGSCLINGSFSEIRITNSEVKGKNSSAGLLAGDSQDCVVDLVDAADSRNKVKTDWIVTKDADLGGIVGSAKKLRLSRAVFGGSVGDSTFNPGSFGRLGSTLGGILGRATTGADVSIDQSEVTSNARLLGSAVYDEIGGVIARASEQAFDYVIRDSVFAGEITIPHQANSHLGKIGGIYAVCCGGSNEQVLNSLNVGLMPQSTTADIGPIEGAFTGPVTGTFYNSTSLTSFVDANEKGDGKTTAELQDIATFSSANWSIAQTATSSVISPAWALSSYDSSTQIWTGSAKIWRITQGSFPSLVWKDFWPGRPVAPSSVTSISPAAGTANLTWAESTRGSFDPVTGYRIEQSVDGGSTWSTSVANTASLATSASVTGLSPGLSYFFRVAGISALGAGLATATSSALLMGSNPGSPQNLAASRLTENSFRVSWDPPSNTGGLSITSYTLQVDKGNGFETVAHTGTSADITGVSINSLWSFRVLATNVVGSSSYAVYTNTPPVPYSGPIVTSFSVREVVADRANSVTLDGMRLSQVTDLFIGTTKLSFTRSGTGQLVVSLPAVAKGVYDLRMVYTGGGVITHQAAFTVVDAPAVLSSRTLLFTSFPGDGFRLPAAAARGIRSAVSSLGEASKIVCTGSTSGTRATASDRRLALRRAQEACDLAKRLVPGVITEVRANPASGVGARFRSVTVQISGY